MRRLIRFLMSMTRWELWTLGVLVIGLIAGVGGLMRQFYVDSTVLVPTTGGTYIEGSVGELQPLNPWFTVQNDVNRDIVSLVFAGLLRYNPETKKIEEDLASMTVSKDGKTYTLRLKDNLLWHDSTVEDPHPVTADDVVFTFQSIQNPEFPNLLQQQNFAGVTVAKVDQRTVTFKLEEPYAFFASNLTLGILPQRSFDGIPVAKFDQHLDYAFHPIGAGPYRVKSVVQTDLSSEVTLERFDRPLAPAYRLDRIVFRIFPDYSTLLSDLRNLQGVRLVPRNADGAPVVPKRFAARTYYLPQYVALFFNLETKSLQDEKLRTGLQLGTDKMAIAKAIQETVLVDTPLLEIDMSNWRYKFDADAAQGALLASKWNLPERVRLQRVLEREEANRTGILSSSTIRLAEGGGIAFSGAYIPMPRGARVNGIAVRDASSGSGSWTVTLPLDTGTGSIRHGENTIRVTNEAGKIVDTFYLIVPKDAQEKARLDSELQLADLFVRSRDGKVPAEQRIAIGDLFLQDGVLRRRVDADPPSIRQNERGEPLTLRLLTSDAPASYRTVAEQIRAQWATLGVNVTVEVPATRAEFEERLLRRQYDLLLFGQSLLDNLDSYPYWHSSGVQKLTGDENDLRRDAYNLSQYVSFQADALLERVRAIGTDADRHKALSELRTVLQADVPAIFLYSPLYTYAHHRDVHGIDLGSLSLHSDRFLSLHKWYVRQDRIFRPGTGWFSFFSWFGTLLVGGGS